MEEAEDRATAIARQRAGEIPVPSGYVVFAETKAFEYECPYDTKEPVLGTFSLRRTFKSTATGMLIATQKITHLKSCEGESYEEEWRDISGNLHREDGPAHTSFSQHHIPEEAYLDEGKKQFYCHGKLIEEVDISHEIFARQPAYVRAYYGEDF